MCIEALATQTTPKFVKELSVAPRITPNLWGPAWLAGTVKPSGSKAKMKLNTPRDKGAENLHWTEGAGQITPTQGLENNNKNIYEKKQNSGI